MASMKHAFTTASGTEGVWLTPSESVFCRWRWDHDTRNLVVEAGNVTRSWASPNLDVSGEAGIRLDLPETAKDIAQLIQRQRAAAS